MSPLTARQVAQAIRDACLEWQRRYPAPSLADHIRPALDALLSRQEAPQEQPSEFNEAEYYYLNCAKFAALAKPDPLLARLLAAYEVMDDTRREVVVKNAEQHAKVWPRQGGER